MKPLAMLLALAGLITLAACEGHDSYPLSGEPCAPEDPVQELDARDCVI
ncbi:hypothetical protein KUV62_22310 [Salipiger bermudensis]|nr:hypothetical protein [Salipiger bermudensis]MBY6006674.1 hypothetical protein [Salipiger bermudensis]